MDVIAQKHAGFITRMTKLLDLFVTMRYIAPTDVIRPPHSSDTIATTTFQNLGIDPEVIGLMRVMPAMHSQLVWGWQWFGIEMIPRSKAVTYFADETDSEFLERMRWGERSWRDGDAKLLPPWMLRLTEGNGYSGQYGTDLIYNTQDQTIIEWSNMGRKGWEESPVRPADVVLDEIIAKFQNLEWIPYWDPDNSDEQPPSRKILEDPIIFQNIWPGGIRIPSNTADAINALREQFGPDGADSLREQTNTLRAFQKMYRDCGWGTDGFDGELFEQKRTQFLREFEELEERKHSAQRQSRVSMVPGQQPFSEEEAVGQTARLDAAVSDMDRFLTRAAGEYAV